MKGPNLDIALEGPQFTDTEAGGPKNDEKYMVVYQKQGLAVFIARVVPIWGYSCIYQQLAHRFKSSAMHRRLSLAIICTY